MPPAITGARQRRTTEATTTTPSGEAAAQNSSQRPSPVTKRPRVGHAVGAVVRSSSTLSSSLSTSPALPTESTAVAAPRQVLPSQPTDDLKERFLQLFTLPEFRGGLDNGALKARFGPSEYERLPLIINELTATAKLAMSKTTATGELFYTLVSDELAAKFSGLDLTARMVYQVIERAGNMGIWTKDIRTQTNVQQQALTKIFKTLESRQLIKPVKSVAAKAKKLYMLYDLTPSQELTGGVWYSDLEFDHEFISELKTFLLHCLRRLNQGRGATLREIREKMIQSQVSRVTLSLEEIQQLIQTLIYDYVVEEEEAPAEADSNEIVYVLARRVAPVGEFKWWDVLVPDFHFRTIHFEDGVVLPPHEPHYHTA